MEYKIVAVNESQDLNEQGKLTRGKRVQFTVNGGKHTLNISMPDFDRGRTNELVKAEAEKVIAIFGKK